MSNFVITFTPHFKRNVKNEIKKIDKKSKIIKCFSNGIVLIQSNLNKEDFINKMLKLNPIFIKHICPAQNVGFLKGSLEEDKEIILKLLLSNNFKVEKYQSFAIQARIVDGGTEMEPLPYSCKDIEVYIGSYFAELGAIPTFSDKLLLNRKDVLIFSILINGKDVYVGSSMSEQNLNFSWDEYRISSRFGKREISRAENKLKEALIKYNISFENTEGIALDLGAAPGGWTKVLVDYGFNVVAVDPGDLHPDLQNHPKVTHYKCRIENLTFNNYFDIIVNDMNIDPKITSEIMNSLVLFLKENGIAIVTFKLPNNPEKDISEGVETISKCYDVLNINSLFHNRQEVTLLIKRKPLIKEHQEERKL